ncbi:uncharacterized protein M421DRAFT_158384 [Didymella exigua CBS 183.55]|uniref:Mid2 domain-containing protein n=1 Tax=Didymella exigua CBS 183.55 TaxID=1150837 RepID=A0A6A5RS35_9PLEO|nr:uncharacterized protein M421DRAFT_158384 [Didymella exigua CBS 183.55]KAF1928317.1 hypothetical protein M421DRAFT_158384 [Didymella exigua CBS 183.55]
MSFYRITFVSCRRFNMPLLWRLILIALAAHSALAANTCYFPNGLASTDEPCDPDALFTQCCGSRSACLTNGLCILEASNDTGINYARGTCTDKTWASSLCPQQCQLNQDTPKNSSAYDFRTNGVQVWQCGSQGYAEEAKYCCESEAERQRCCSTQEAVFTLQGAAVGASTSASTTSTSLLITSAGSLITSADSSTSGPTATPSSSAEAASTTASLAAPTTTAQPRETNGTAIGIGAGVGGAIGLIILVTVVLLFVWRRRRTKRHGMIEGPGVSELHGTAKQPVEVWTQPAEVYTQPHELPSRGQPVWELPADPRTPRVV